MRTYEYPQKQKPWGKASKLLAGCSLAAVSVLGVMPQALAADDARIRELETKLEQSVRMIEKLSSEVEGLKKKSTQGYSHSLSTERLEALEDQVLEIDDRVGSRAVAHGFDASAIDIGGFLHTTATHIDANGGSATSFDQTVFELLLKADLGDGWSAFFAQAFMRNAATTLTPVNAGTDLRANFGRFNGTGGAVTTDTPIAWANYKHNDQLNVRIGRYLTPAGIINIEHFPALLLDPEQPQFLRPFGGDTLLPNFLTGVNVHGQKFLGDNALKYDAYTGNFAGDGEKFITGGRLAYGLNEHGVTVGVNGLFGQRQKAGNAGLDTGYEVYGADLLIDRGQLLWKNEIFWSKEDNGGDRMGWYTQPAWRINDKWTGFYKYDVLDNGNASDADSTEHVVGLTYKPTRNVHLRGIARFKEFEAGSVAGLNRDENVSIYQMLATFNF